jgi:spore maturation protein SpmB
MSDSIHLALPYIAASQAQKHVTHNEALRILDALVMLAVKDRDLSAPPGSPADGDRYLVKPAGTGGFAARNNQIAHYRDGGWVFHAPQAGWLCYVEDEDALIVFDGAAWISLLQNVPRLGVGTTADDTNPFSAKLNNALWTARYDSEGGDGNLRYKLNKETAGDVLSLLFQTGYSGRAEIGLIGDDNLALKVSADGTAWTTALVIDRATGRMSAAADPVAGLGVATRRYADSYAVLRDLGAPRGLLPGMKPAASRSSMGATLSDAAKWIGGVLGPDGNIYGMPFNVTDILIVNPVAGTAMRSAMGATLTGTGKWLGGVMGQDGKLYGIPADSTDILIIDTVAGTASRSAMGATLTGSGKWRGGVLAPDGKIYGIPFDATDILIIDPVAGTAVRSAMGATLTGTNKWIGGVLGPNGKIYGIPCNSTDILVIDPVAGTASRSAMGATLTGTGKWFGGALGPDGRIYGIPLDSADILIVDPLAGTAARSAMGATLSGGGGKWGGGALGPDGKVYGIPFNSTDILIIDPVAGTATRSALGATLTGGVKWGGGVLGPDGRIYGMPYDSTDVLLVGAFLANFRSDLLCSPYLNTL